MSNNLLIYKVLHIMDIVWNYISVILGLIMISGCILPYVGKELNILQSESTVMCLGILIQVFWITLACNIVILVYDILLNFILQKNAIITDSYKKSTAFKITAGIVAVMNLALDTELIISFFLVMRPIRPDWCMHAIICVSVGLALFLLNIFLPRFRNKQSPKKTVVGTE